MILQNQLQFAEMPDMYKECRFSNMKSSVYQLPESKEIFIQAAKAVKYWLENIQQMQKQGIGLYIYSNTKGSGKTRLVCSMANEMIEKHLGKWKDERSAEDIIKDIYAGRNSIKAPLNFD